jgi:tetrahydromethanopterin S-methyltransferase subunit G
MSDVIMALGESELQRIGDYVRGHLYAWLNDVAPQVIVGPHLLERTVRVEEELKNLREAMEFRFAAVDKRFEAQLAVMKAGFDAVDKRLAAVDKRFETIDKRFDAQQASMKVQQWIVIVGFVILGTMVSILGLAA